MTFDPIAASTSGAISKQEEDKKLPKQQQEEQGILSVFNFDADKKSVDAKKFQQGLFGLGFDEETANSIFNIFDSNNDKSISEEEYNFVLNNMKSLGIEISKSGSIVESFFEYQAKLKESGKIKEEKPAVLDSTEQTIINPDDIEHLNNKYNIGIDFDSPEDMTDEQLARLQQAYTIETNAAQLEATHNAMLQYFDTLGKIDEAYDAAKDFLNAGLTRNDVENYYNNEKLKQDFLTSVIRSGGSIEVSEDNIEVLQQLTYNTISNFSNDSDIIEYATNVLGMSFEEIENYVQSYLLERAKRYGFDDSQYDFYDVKITQNEDGAYFFGLYTDNDGEKELTTDTSNYLSAEDFAEIFSKNLKIDKSNTLSFEQAYQIATGVEYNEQLIAEVMQTQDAYQTAASMQQSAIIFEQTMAQLSPNEALEYFNRIAEANNDGRTGEDLFNEYYRQMFEKYPDRFQGSDITGIEGVSCGGIEIHDGYLWQEFTFSDELTQDDIDDIAGKQFLYKDVDENGNVKYYQVVNLENQNEILCNLASEDEPDVINAQFFAGRIYDCHWNYNHLECFNKVNESVKNNNLYLETVKDEFNEEYGENAFDTLLEQYPKMYEEAFGKNELSSKLSAYQKDMDSYSQKLSQALSIGCFVAGFIPGVNVAFWVPIAIAGLDNGIDLLNLATNNKDGEFVQWSTNTAVEAGMFLIGMKINAFANAAGNKLTHNLISKGCNFALKHANWTEALIEYGVDNAASILWDFGKGLATGEFYERDEYGNIIKDENGNPKLSWDKVGSMVLSDALFNTADLRNGMALYRSLKAGDSIDLGNGTRFKIDPDDGTVRYTYDNGSEVTIINGKAVLTEANSTQYDLSYNKATRSWEMPDGTKVDLGNSSSIPQSYTVIDGMATYKPLFDAMGKPIVQADDTTCVPVSSLNEIAGKSGLAQAILNEIEPIEGKPGYYRISKFGDDFEFKVDSETNLLQTIYDAYRCSRFGENSKGDYVSNFLTELLGSGNEVRQILSSDNLPKIREYLNDDNTVLGVSFDGVEGLSNGHAYKIVSIDETTNRMTVQDTDGTTIEIDADSYMGKVQIEGMSYGNLPALVDSTLVPRMLGGKASNTKCNPIDPTTGYSDSIHGKVVASETLIFSDDYGTIKFDDGTEGRTFYDSTTNTTRVDILDAKGNPTGEVLIYKNDGSITRYASATDEQNGIYIKIDANGNNIEEGLADGHVRTRKAGDPADKYTETWKGTDGKEYKRTHKAGAPADEYSETVTIKDSKTNKTLAEYTRTHKSGDKPNVFTITVNGKQYTETVTGGKYNEITFKDKGGKQQTLYYPAKEIPEIYQQTGIGLNYRHVTSRNGANGSFEFEWNSSSGREHGLETVHLKGVHTTEAMQELENAATRTPPTIMLNGNQTATVTYQGANGGAKFYTVKNDSNGQVTWVKIQGGAVSFSESNGSYGNPKTLIPQAAYDGIWNNRGNIMPVTGADGTTYFAVLDNNNNVHYFRQMGKTTFEVSTGMLGQGVLKQLKSLPMVKISGWK